jgi:hypothetical protein
MSNPSIQIGDSVREMTDEEHAQYKKDIKAFAQEAKDAADREALKQATLAKLGLTADEVAALLS